MKDSALVITKLSNVWMKQCGAYVNLCNVTTCKFWGFVSTPEETSVQCQDFCFVYNLAPVLFLEKALELKREVCQCKAHHQKYL